MHLKRAWFKITSKGVLCITLLTLLAAAGCDEAQHEKEPSKLDREQLLAHVRVLSSDEYEGRKTGTPGGLKALEYVKTQLGSFNLNPCYEDIAQPFSFMSRSSDVPVVGTNVVGIVAGTSASTKKIVITAHFDHLGTRDEGIYNGADDNASGTGSLLEIARYFSENPPAHSIIFASLDGEEFGLKGAAALVTTNCIVDNDVVLNINMDMVSRSDKKELYVSGTSHYPFLKPVVESVSPQDHVKLIFGHDVEGTGSNDWTYASDQGPFHQIGIPFLYFGVEDHAGYHNPTDDFENITPEFYVGASNTILDVILAFDRSLDTLKAQ